MCDDNIRDDLECYLLKLVASLVEAVEEEIEVINREILHLLADEWIIRLGTYFAE
jgi:hypothetical protein